MFGALCFLGLFLVVASPGERLSRLLFERPAAHESESDDTAAVCALSGFSDSTACWRELANSYEAALNQLTAQVSSASVNATVAQVVVRFLNHSGSSASEYRYSPKRPGAHNRTRNLATASTSTIVPLPPLSVKPTYRGSLAPTARSQYRIPPIIHQQLLAENALIPAQYRETVASVVETHRHLDYWLWHTDQLLALVMERRPEMAALLARAPRRVHRSDILRYLTVYEEGGFYMDLDMRAHRAIDPLLRRYDCVIGREPDAMSLYIWSRAIMLTNAAFGARAHHPFVGFLLERLRDRDVSGHVVGATGPLFMTETFFEWARNSHCSLPSFERLHSAREPLLVCDCALLPWFAFMPRVENGPFRILCEHAFRLREKNAMSVCRQWREHRYRNPLLLEHTFLEHVWMHIIYNRRARRHDDFAVGELLFPAPAPAPTPTRSTRAPAAMSTATTQLLQLQPRPQVAKPLDPIGHMQASNKSAVPQRTWSRRGLRPKVK